MRVALIADAHANAAALSAVFEAIERESVDLTVCLGDIVGYHAEPAECIALVRQHADVVVAGNHDRDIVRSAALGTRSSARAVQRWTREILAADDLAYLQGLESHVVADLFVAAHGAYLSEIYVSGYVTSTMLEENLQAIAARPGWPGLAFCGHTHVPMLGAWDGSACQEHDLHDPVAWSAAERVVLINPGSVGQPRDGDTRAAFAIVDVEARRCEVRRVRYDLERTVRAMEKAGFAEELIERLREGR